MLKKIRAYYHLTKPGIIYGNLFTAIGGFLYASMTQVDLVNLAGIIGGTWLVIGSGCVFNNYLDRGIDKRMKRTKKRELVTGAITPRAALVFGAVLGIIGIDVLAILTNWLTTILGVIGLVSYTLIYTYTKRHTVHATLIGTIPGAISIVAGYTAATNRLDISAALLFAIMAFWQMAHFYAISIYRLKEYKAAKVPVASIIYGVKRTKLLIFVYTIGFLWSLLALVWFGHVGFIFMAVMLPLAIWWSAIALLGLWADDANAWAGKIFWQSLILLSSFGTLLAFDSWLL